MTHARIVGALLAAAALLGAVFASAAPTKDQCIEANEGAPPLRATGKLRAARAQLLVCVAKTCPGPVRDDCTEQITAIDRAMPTIVVEAKDANGMDLTAVVVTSDGAPLATTLDGGALPVDPGEHIFRFSANGLPSVEKKLVIREGDKDRRVRVMLGASPTAPPAAVASPAAASSSNGSTQRTIGLVAGGTGVAGLLLGSVFGLVAKSTYDSAVQSCPNGPTLPCYQPGVTGGQTAHDEATISTVGFVAGGALLAAGAALLFTSPRDHAVSVGPTGFVGGAGLGVRGVW